MNRADLPCPCEWFVLLLVVLGDLNHLVMGLLGDCVGWHWCRLWRRHLVLVNSLRVVGDEGLMIGGRKRRQESWEWTMDREGIRRVSEGVKEVAWRGAAAWRGHYYTRICAPVWPHLLELMNGCLNILLRNILNDPLTAVVLGVLRLFSVLNPLSRRLEILIVDHWGLSFTTLGMWCLLSLWTYPLYLSYVLFYFWVTIYLLLLSHGIVQPLRRILHHHFWWLPNPLLLLRNISFRSVSAWGNPLSVVDRIIGVIFMLDGCWPSLSCHLWSIRHVSYGVLILTRKLRVMKILIIFYEMLLFHVHKLWNALLTHHRVN